MKIWCGLCSCSFDQAVTFTHTRGKKHSKKNKNMSKLFSLLPNDIKITCISYIFPRVHNFISFCRQIHSYNMNQCMYQLNVCNFDEFLAYVYWYSYNQLQIIDLYMLQSNV